MFSIPTRTQYGIRALVRLAQRMVAVDAAASSSNRDEAPIVTSAEIARAEGISPKYLEGILAQLKAAGLVLSERGNRGGYRLARPPEQIPMIVVVEALEGVIRPVDCIEDQGCCALGAACHPRRFWIGLKDAIDGYLASRTLKDVIDS